MKYATWLAKWLEDYVKIQVKPRTFSRYEKIAIIHVIPHLGNKDLEELSPMVLQSFVAEISQRGNVKTAGRLQQTRLIR